MPISVQEKTNLYSEIHQQATAALDGESDAIAMMATISCLLSRAFDHFYWTGFYRWNGSQLIIGPYQGTLGCLRIDKGRGVCGKVAATGEAEIVDDVDDFPGHIACDANSRSEIVLPVYDQEKKFIAVLDIDSEHKAAFDTLDKDWLERILADTLGRIVA